MRLLTCLVFMLSAVAALAQNYQPYTSGRTYHFASPFGWQGLYGMRADSIEIAGGDTVFHHARIVGETGYDSCVVTPYAPSWTGLRSIKRANGSHVFINHDGDSIILKPNAVLGESWTMFRFILSGEYMECRVTKITEQRLPNGELDTVKTIVMSRKKADGDPEESAWNKRKIMLSKNNGFVRVFDLHAFPAESSDYLLSGVGPFTHGETFDFEPGDVFHYYIDEGQRLPPPSTNWWPEGKYVIRTVFAENFADNRDAVTYTFLEQVFMLSGSGTEVQIDTIEEGHIVTEYFDRLSLPVFSAIPWQAQNTSNLLHYRLFPDWKQSRRPYVSFCFPEYEQMGENCWQPSSAKSSGCVTFIKGAGLLQDKTFSDGTSRTEHLFYFKKGDETWGKSFDVLNFFKPQDPTAQPTLPGDSLTGPIYTMYPNPVADWMRVEVLHHKEETVKVSVTDMIGKVAFYHELDHSGSGTETVPIDFSRLREGIYLLHLETGNHKLTKKVIKPQ